jgi:hypothetical protein
MPHARLEDAVNMFDERKVPALNHVLLVLFAVVERDFLGILQQARVREPQLALECRLMCGVGTERRRDLLENVG